MTLIPLQSSSSELVSAFFLLPFPFLPAPPPRGPLVLPGLGPGFFLNGGAGAGEPILSPGDSGCEEGSGESR